MTNIFLITIDALRADHLGYMGYLEVKNIDLFAKENIVFKNAFSTGPRTDLSFPSIMNGVYSTSYYSNIKNRPENIAEILKEYGYITGAFNSNPHFRILKFDKGFDRFEDFLTETKEDRSKKSEKIKKVFVKIFGKKSYLTKKIAKMFTHFSKKIVLPYVRAEKTNKEAIKWLKNQNKNDKIFCWIHYMDPHYPYMPPEKYIENNISKKEIIKLNRKSLYYRDELKEDEIKKIIELYDGEIKYLDEKLGEFFKKLKELEFYEDSIIIITSDHGESFGEHNRYGHDYDVLYQKQLHVPLIIKTTKNKKHEYIKSVSLLDLPKTIIDLLKIKDDSIPGINLLDKKREYIISEGFKRPGLETGETKFELDKKNMMFSCQNEIWKLIKDNIHGKEELYNIKEDEFEKINLLKDRSEEYKKLNQVLKKHFEKVKVVKERDLIKKNIKKLQQNKKI